MHAFGSTCEEMSLKLTSMVSFSAKQSGPLSKDFVVTDVCACSPFYKKFRTQKLYIWHHDIRAFTTSVGFLFSSIMVLSKFTLISKVLEQFLVSPITTATSSQCSSTATTPQLSPAPSCLNLWVLEQLEKFWPVIFFFNEIVVLILFPYGFLLMYRERLLCIDILSCYLA